MSEDLAGDAYVQGVVFEDGEGLNELHVCVGARSPELLEASLREGFEKLVSRHLDTPDFSGRVQMVVLGEVTPPTPEIWAVVMRVERELRAALEQRRARTQSGRPIAIAFEYTGSGED